jgi:CheY-like chemotaxis protein
MFTIPGLYCLVFDEGADLVFSADAKTHQRICALMQRVLIVDPQPSSAKLLSELLRDVCPCQIWTASGGHRALSVAQAAAPHLVFVEHGGDLDGPVFTRALRRSELACRQSPVIMFSTEATAAVIIRARDAGVHEFLRKPYTIKDLLRRLEAVAARPRDWVEGVGYVGPDRRRFKSGDYAGPLKRRVDHAVTPDEARVVQALKILKAALAAIESDPHQALRSMLAQCEDLRASDRAKSDMKLRGAAVTLGQTLMTLDATRLRRAELEPLAAPLLAYLPLEAPAARRPAA